MLSRPGRALLLAFFLLMGAVPGAHADSRTLAQIALQSSDVPRGFQEFAGGYISDALAARYDRVPIKTYVRLGRVMGYEAAFQRQTSAGICCIFNEVIQWTDSGASRRGYSLHVIASRIPYARYRGYWERKSQDGKFWVASFPCHCNGRSEIVDMVEAVKDSYTVHIEMHFVRGTANTGQMAQTALRFTRIVLARVP